MTKGEKMIYILQIDVENYRSFSKNHTEEDLEKWSKWNDLFHHPKRFGDIWEEPEFFLFSGEKKQMKKEAKKPIPDFAPGYVVRCCSERAKSVIETLTGDAIEFLPIKTPVGTYYDMNLPIVDCLNEAKSELDRLSTGRIFKIIKYSLNWDCIEENHLFWIKGVGRTPIYVSAEMKQLLESSNFPELSFIPIPLVEEEAN
jgi:hypothetical protein